MAIRSTQLSLFCSGLLALSGAVAHAQNCPSQGIRPGTYYIASALGDNRCLDRRTQDSNSIQFYFCNGQSDEQFQLESGDLGSGCYRIRAVYNGTSDPHFLDPVAGGLPGLALLIEADSGNLKSYYWRILKNANNTYSFINELNDESPNQQCMNRRDPDDQGRAQLLHCDFGDNRYQFWLASSKAELDKLKNQKAKPNKAPKK
ncbi:exported hypothetical protein [Acidobacteriia bacterium SbA2]|nr:exported hypothetical protein [Acidobacteriia bacterium SbA2]